MELYKINSENKLETVQPKQFKLEREIQNLRQFNGNVNFNPENQTSIDNIESILIKPASDILLSEKDYARGRENLEAILEKAVS